MSEKSLARYTCVSCCEPLIHTSLPIDSTAC